MKMIVKRILSLALCAVLVMGLLPALPAAAEEAALPEGTVIYRNPETDSCTVPMAPELPGERFRDPREEMGTMDITQNDSVYNFTTFDDLRTLASKTYTNFSIANYTGTEDLIITENITLPDNLALICESLIISVGVTMSAEQFVNTDYTVVDGTLVLTEGFLNARRVLRVNGTIRLTSRSGLSITSSTLFTGRSNVIGENYRILCMYQFSSVEDVARFLEDESYLNDSYYHYQLYLGSSEGGGLFTIGRDLTIPDRVMFYVENDGVILSSGCTLTINGKAWFDDITINGTLRNDHEVYLFGAASFRSDASYTGTGCLYVYPESGGMSYETAVSGLDFSRFDIHYDSAEGRYVLSTLPRLDTPTELQWHSFHSGDTMIREPGAISWKTVATEETGECTYEILVYKKGREEPVFESWCRPDVEETWMSYHPFSDANPESGTYYFTVQAFGTETYKSSEIAVSSEWVYVNPNVKFPVAGNLRWDWPNPRWNDPAGAEQCDRVWVWFYFAESPEAEPKFVQGYGSSFENYVEGRSFLRVSEELVKKCGAGYYFFSVRYSSEDITKAISGDMSALSPGYYYDPADHTYTAETTVPPTCTEQGHTTYKCAICGHSYDGDFTPATGHSWTNATCTTPKTCSACGQTEGGSLGHSYADGICTRCGGADPDYVPPVVGPTGVTRLAGAGRVETSLAIAEALKAQMGVQRFSNVVVASALNFPDALAGSYLAAKADAPILLTYAGAQAQVMAYIHGNLQPGGTVYILGGESAVSANFANMLSASGIRCQRVAGSDRFSTNLAILNQAGVTSGQPILVCTAFGFADSLSVSATGLPILLVGKNLNAAQKEFLSRCSGGKIWIVGGTGAVSADVEKELKTYASEIQRLAGAGRHETSVLVADTFFLNAKSAVIAYSMNFPDGLCGGPLAYALGAPLILTNSSDTRVNAFTDPRGIGAGYVLGGGALVNDAAARRIFHLAAGTAIPTK